MNEALTFAPIITAPVRLAHNRLFAADLARVKPGFPARYEAVLLPTDEALAPVQEAVTKAARAGWPGSLDEHATIKLPIWTTGEDRGYPQRMFIRATSDANNVPVLMDVRGERVDVGGVRPTDFYGGALVVVQMTPRVYSFKADDGELHEGVSLDLDGLRVVNANREAYPVLSFKRERTVTDAFMAVRSELNGASAEAPAPAPESTVEDDLDF